MSSITSKTGEQIQSKAAAPVDPKTLMSNEDILEAVDAGLITLEAAKARMKEISVPVGKASIKVSRKGGVSIYGLQRMPYTFYVGQLELVESQGILIVGPELKKFIDGVRHMLVLKSDSAEILAHKQKLREEAVARGDKRVKAE